MVHVQQIAREPHPPGSKAHGQVLDYLIEALRALSLDVQVQGGSRHNPQLTNVLARPRNPTGSNVVLFVAHYDSVPSGPGAADDTAGVATLLETARLLGSGSPAKNEVAFLFTDGEELPSTGADVFIKENSAFLRHVRVVLNFEARGNRGPVIMFETGPKNLELMRMFRACPYPVASSFAQSVYEKMPNDTDLTLFKAAGLAGYNFAPIMGLETYHRPADTWQNLDRRSLAHYGSYATTLARRLAQADLESLASTRDGIFFPLFRGVLVVYPDSWAVPFAVGASLTYGTIMVIGLARQRLRIFRVLLAIVLAIVVPALMVVIALAGQKGLKAFFNHQHYDLARLLTISHLIMVLSLALIAAILLALKFWLSRKVGAAEMLAGTLLVWLALSVISAAWMRGFSYLLVWPALFGTWGLWMITRRDPASRAARSGATLCSLAPGCLLFAPVILLAYHALTIMMLPIFVGLSSHLAFLTYIDHGIASRRNKRVPISEDEPGSDKRDSRQPPSSCVSPN
jgi:hypothetical protein